MTRRPRSARGPAAPSPRPGTISSRVPGAMSAFAHRQRLDRPVDRQVIPEVARVASRSARRLEPATIAVHLGETLSRGTLSPADPARPSRPARSGRAPSPGRRPRTPRGVRPGRPPRSRKPAKADATPTSRTPGALPRHRRRCPARRSIDRPLTLRGAVRPWRDRLSTSDPVHLVDPRDRGAHSVAASILRRMPGATHRTRLLTPATRPVRRNQGSVEG